MTEMIEMGKISSRGQVAIPSGIRAHLGLDEGSKVLFFVEDDMVLMKKVTSASLSELTRPLREASKNIQESQVNRLVHKMRKR
ncbi:MAG: AbrB/MazE/SpoVT family DNA-binding domain-containing protein [Nanoarchaeota archaeon]|nr:AbrB/MazE/SpoVT family DNA-binding domain-containing protein [Nanoarchaeota archaeon]